MNRTTKQLGTAILLMAVLSVSLLLGCCATQRDATEIKHMLSQIEAGQAQSEGLVERMDSLATTGAEADNQLRNELRYSVEEMQGQMETLLQNYNDLMAMISQGFGRDTVYRELRPSDGAQEDIPVDTMPVIDEQRVPEVDCDSTYDEAYILVRRNEYQTAITGFETFIKGCPDHDNMPNAHFWMGQCFYLLERYDDAIAQFEMILADYPNWPQRSQAMFKIARNLEEQGKTADAREWFQKVVDEYPGSFDANQASEKLKELK